MTWKQVAALGLLIAGAAVMAGLAQKEIALVFAGAAAGFVSSSAAGAGSGRDRDREHTTRPAA